MFIIILLITTLVVYYILSYIHAQNIRKKIDVRKSTFYSKLNTYVRLLLKNKIVKVKYKITPLILLMFMVILFLSAFFLFNMIIQIKSTAFILSIPFFILPIILIKFTVNKEKTEILKVLPMYIINLKNHVSEENNIIKAIRVTSVEEPLNKYINDFKLNISRGMNVIVAFDLLRESINVNIVNDLINSCATCYLNGGNFAKLLERYLEIITKENRHKEETREKAYSDILTLFVMVMLNVFVVIFFVFGNKEYATIIRETLLGKIIIDFNAISYIFIGYLISKIYKED